MDEKVSPTQGASDLKSEYLGLLEFASPTQAKVLKSLILTDSQRETAAELGLSQGTVGGHLVRVRRAAAARGFAPGSDMTNPAPAPFFVKGVSTYYDRDGEVRGQWVKSQIDGHQLRELSEQMAEAFFTERKPLKRFPKPRRACDDEILTVYPLADLHLGMFSWARETGADYDCDIAVDMAIESHNRLLDRTPDSKYCVLAQLGDLLHLDDDTNQTKRSGHSLDVDTRYQRVAEVGLHLYRRLIDMCLSKHDRVHIVNVPGNHDDVSGYWLGMAAKVAYENEPRVTVDNSPGPYFYHRFGNNLFGFAHGHCCKREALGEIMVADVPLDVGEAENRFWFTGHIHHDTVLDGRIAKVRSLRTLAAKDSWHSAKGYRTARDAKAYVYHSEWGEDERYTVSAREVEYSLSN